MLELVECGFAERPVAHTFLYIVQQESADGYVKVGLAKRPAERMRALQNASPYPLRVLALIWCHESLEAYLHERFREDRIRGEWFRPAPELLDYAERHYEWDVVEAEARGVDPWKDVDWDGDDWEDQFERVLLARRPR